MAGVLQLEGATATGQKAPKVRPGHGSITVGLAATYGRHPNEADDYVFAAKKIPNL
jgi:hypothetical protein